MLSSWALLLFLFSFPSEEKVNDEDGASDWGSSTTAVEVELKWRAQEEKDLISLRFLTDFRVLLNWRISHALWLIRIRVEPLIQFA
ncbi:hypothetical protein ACFX2I_014641 [Malus domestica]